MPRLLRTVGRTAVIAGTASAVSGRVQKRQYDRWSEQEQQAAAQQQAAQQQAAPPQQAAAPSTDDTMDKLADLAKLHAAGVLDDDEFKAAKAKVLGI